MIYMSQIALYVDIEEIAQKFSNEVSQNFTDFKCDSQCKRFFHDKQFIF